MTNLFRQVWLLVFPGTLLASQQNGGEQYTLVKNCTDKAKNATKSCRYFLKLVDEKCGSTSSYCDKYEQDLIKACATDFCKQCLQKANIAYVDCVKYYKTAIPSSPKSKKVCDTMKEDLRHKCPVICQGSLGLSKDRPAKSCKHINDANKTLKSGLYWIRPDGDATSVQAYCDMRFHGGGWTLASYGYVYTTAYGKQDTRNKGIPNMNHPNGFNWHPASRSSSNGLISLQHGAVNLARNASFMIMAAGNNPSSGGIDSYTYVFLIDISKNPYRITFANHGRYYGAVGTSAIPKMHVLEFTVQALKGESGSAKRYALAEALGVSWSDTYPTGYGFTPVNAQYGSWDRGPFFPSFHSGDRQQGGCTHPKAFPPDIKKGCPEYVHNGWHSLHSMQKNGQTSIWFK